jgi:hypothetical protein
MKKHQKPSCGAALFALIVSLFTLGCDTNVDPVGPGDGAEDPDAEVPEDGDMDEEGGPEIETDPAEEEEPFLPCTGGESLTLLYLDLEGNPVADLAVALDSGGRILEGTTDAAGSVTFEGLDFCNVPVHVTCVGEGYAYTLTDIGAMGFVPDPLTITLEVIFWVIFPETRSMSGNAIHSVSGSGMIFSIPGVTKGVSVDRYDLLYGFVGTNLHMSVMEFTGEPEARVPIGYTLLRYDTPAEGVDGPEVECQPAEFQTASVRLYYDIAPDSPFQEPHLTNPMQEGIFMSPGYGHEDSWSVGFQTTWTRGEDFDTLEAAWTDEALAEVVDPNFYVCVAAYPGGGHSLFVWLRLPGDPEAWDAVTVHDAADYTNAVTSIDPAHATPFDFEYSYEVPADFQVVIHFLSAYDKWWYVERPADRSTINFASMPWPSSVDQSEFFANPDMESMDFALMASSFDQNPFNGYVLWSTRQWQYHHRRSHSYVGSYHIQFP